MKKSFANTWIILNKQEKRKFIYLTSSGIALSFLDIIFLAGLIYIVQFYMQPASSVALSYPWVSGNSVPLILAFFVCFTIKNYLAYLHIAKQNRYLGSVAIRISSENLASYQHSEFAASNNDDSSKHIRKICFQPFEFAQYMLAGTQQVIVQISLIVVATLAIILVSAKLFLLLMIILLPPVAVTFSLIRRRLGKVKREIKESNELSFRFLLDALKGYVEGNIYNKNNFFHKRFIDQRTRFSSNLFSSLTLQGLPTRLIEVFAVLGLILLIALSKDSNDSVVIIGGFMAAAYKVIPGIVKIINTSGQMRAYHFEAEEMKYSGRTSGEENNDSSPINSINLQDVSFKFADKPIISNLNMDLQRGDFIGVTGASGLGKTTLLNIILGFLHPQSGHVSINNKRILNGDARHFWPSFAYVRQQAFIFHDSLIANITLEEEVLNEERLRVAMSVSGLDSIGKTWPVGILTEISENGKNISGGQAQRIAIARAIYKSTDVLLLDEPFNELDAQSTHSILKKMKEFAKDGRIVILITHDQSLLSYCNKSIVLNER